MSGKIKRIMKKAAVIFCISFTGMFALMYIFMYVVNKNDYGKTGAQEDHPANTEQESITAGHGEKTEKDQKTEAEKLAEKWGIKITSRVKQDFRRVLLEEDYGQFSGKDVSENLKEDFSFAYPENLFYRAEAYEDDDREAYRVLFTGKGNDASLLYSQEKHSRSGDYRELLEELYQMDKESLQEAETLDHPSSLYVINGFEKDELEVYKVVRMDEENIYTMIVKTPVQSEEDVQSMITFYTEYLYRSCGFSGSSRKPRSYAEYLRGVD